jgi:hypothetical protein
MSEPPNTFDLSREQQDTAALLEQLLGSAVADRYVDFCRLAGGAFALRVSRPVAAHALRELDSTLRHILEVPLEAQAPVEPDDLKKLEQAQNRLRDLGYDNDAIRLARKGLTPRLSHKEQIRKILARLGFDAAGDIAKKWISLSDAFGKAHQRSFHRSLQVDDEFRAQYLEPFDTVIRAVAIALQTRYVALMHRVEELAATPNRAEAAASFASEIPGALPLQWHFFQRLGTGDWLPHLAKQGLLAEPLPGLALSGDPEGVRFRQWPAGDYLRRMAGSSDLQTRKGAIHALRAVADSEHPDVQRVGMEILAALPPGESAPLADVASSWLGRDAGFAVLQPAEKLIKTLAAGQKCAAALAVARELLQVWEEDGHPATLYGRNMYEHHLPILMAPLTTNCRVEALRLVVTLLSRAGEIGHRIDIDHYSQRSIADDELANYDVYSALTSAVRRSAEMLVDSDPATTRSVIEVLTCNSPKVFVRLAVHVLARAPAAASDLAEALLLTPELIEGEWCRHEYAALALAWFPSLSPGQQAAILGVVDTIPGKFRPLWIARFEEQNGAPPTAEEMETFAKYQIRNALYRWRSVLPRDRQDEVDRIVDELGDPDSWRTQFLLGEISPLTAVEFTTRPVSEVVAFLRTWRPAEESPQQTVTALAQELQNAVYGDPTRYAAAADQFATLKPIYIRRVLDGLQNAARNQREFEWSNPLRLIQHVLREHSQTIDPHTFSEGDDRNWQWAVMTASELLAAGLGRGADGIGFEHAALVSALVANVVALAPSIPGPDNFEERFRKNPFFAAEVTPRGIAVKLSILLMFWLSKDPTTLIGLENRDALRNLPAVRRALEAELADCSLDGRIARAVMGRYLQFLFYFGEDWLRGQMPSLFPVDLDDLRRATWLGYLGHAERTIAELMPELSGCYAEEITRSARGDVDRDFRDFYQDRLVDHLMILYLWGFLTEDLLQQFWREAPADMRQRAMWFLGCRVSEPSSEAPDEVRARACAYWERRLAAATHAPDPDWYRSELASFTRWCIRGQLDELWLCDQLLRMLEAGFAPNDAFSIVEWLQQITSRHLDRAVEVLTALVRHPRVSPWAYVTQREPIRAVLSAGLAEGAPQTVERVHELVSFLSTVGETSYLDLVRPQTAAGERPVCEPTSAPTGG